MIINHEIRDTRESFMHRLVAPGKAVGGWTVYRMPAVLPIKNVGTFVSVTEYWKGTEPFPNPNKSIW